MTLPYPAGLTLPESPEQLLERTKLARTPSIVSNLARMFAAVTIGAPLLLEGPPGIGKTVSVQEAARLVEKDVERINFSANTSVEQLLGTIVPRVVDGERVFEWQDGTLVRAIKQRKWLLLDEINLAAPEVLDCLSKLLTRCAVGPVFAICWAGICYFMRLFSTHNRHAMYHSRPYFNLH